jgi:hypothetical protein
MAAPTTGVFGGPLDRRVVLGATGLSVVYAGFVIAQSSLASFYTLDDPYIHMSLAENIARGHYGVNLEDVSNPSSSIIWPFLLALCERLGVLVWAPLVINIASFALTLRLLFAFAMERLGPGRNPTNTLIFTGLAALAFNLFGVVLTGMEHSLHTLVSVAGVIRVLDKRYDRIALLVLVASPLLRFEGAAVLAFGIAAALYDRQFRFAAIAAGATLACFGLYFAGLHAMGLPLLPSSVLAKSAVSSSVVDGGSVLGSILANADANRVTDYAPLFFLFELAFAWAAFRRRGRDRVVAVGFLTLNAAAFAFGKMNSYSRYEVYILCVLLVGLIHLFPAVLQFALRWMVAAIALGVAFSAISNFSGMQIVGNTPMAARNIDRQQHQMHRLVETCWRAPIAVNDLGWVSFRNDLYVLDLGGLGNEEARKASAANQVGWEARLMAAHRVEAAAVYTDWFDPLPADWIHVGDLVLDDRRITPYSDTVAFFGTNPAAADRLRRCLVQLAKGLPAGARIVPAA